jgi:quercetin dioxygenase-like cupin family protein
MRTIGAMRDLDGIRILGPSDGTTREGRGSTLREIVGAGETDGRWRLGEVIAEPDESVATHLHPGEPEAIIVLEGQLELHGSDGVEHVGPGDLIFIPPDTEHGLRTPTGGRWLAIWPIGNRVPGPRYD